MQRHQPCPAPRSALTPSMIPPSTSTRCPAIGGALGSSPQRQRLRRSGRKKRRLLRPRSSETSVPAGGHGVWRKHESTAAPGKPDAAETNPDAAETNPDTQRPEPGSPGPDAVRVRATPCLKRRCRESSSNPALSGRWEGGVGGTVGHRRKVTFQLKPGSPVVSQASANLCVYLFSVFICVDLCFYLCLSVFICVYLFSVYPAVSRAEEF